MSERMLPTFQRIENPDLAKEVAAEYQRLYELDPQRYATMIDKEGYVSENEAADLHIKEDQVLYVVRDHQGTIIGYAKGEVLDADQSFPKMTEPVLCDYKGMADSLTIDDLEVFEKGRGLGSQLLKHLKADGYELIDLKAKGERRQHFYERNGFSDTTLRDGEHRILAWHNPTYEN